MSSVARERKLTEKGRNYVLQLKTKERKECAKNVREFLSKLKQNLEEESIELNFIRDRYAKWLSKYEAFLIAHDYCQGVIESEEEKAEDQKQFDCLNAEFAAFKASMEEWFTTKERSFAPSIRPEDSASRMTKESKSSILSIESQARARNWQSF